MLKPGILRDNVMARKLIPNDNTQNYPFFRLKLVAECLNTVAIELWDLNGRQFDVHTQ